MDPGFNLTFTSSFNSHYMFRLPTSAGSSGAVGARSLSICARSTWTPMGLQGSSIIGYGTNLAALHQELS